MLSISGVSKAFGGRTLFADASVQVNRGDRIGLVGPNGAGKSTLLALILGTESPDEGKIILERNVAIGYLPQESAPAGNETVLELATAITPEIELLQKQLKAWESDHPAGDVPPEQHHSAKAHSHGAKRDAHPTVAVHDHHAPDVHARFEELGGYQLEAKAKKILAGLSFRESDFNRPARRCPGRMREELRRKFRRLD